MSESLHELLELAHGFAVAGSIMPFRSACVELGVVGTETSKAAAALIESARIEMKLPDKPPREQYRDAIGLALTRVEQRELTAQLLRCAADIVCEDLNRGPIAKASDFLGLTLSDNERDAYLACSALGGTSPNKEEYRARLLEAAQQLDEVS